MNITSKTDIGLKREENQDRAWYGQLGSDAVLAIVCDGMGGENAGSVASELAVRLFVDKIKAGFHDSMEETGIRNLMIGSILSTNAAIYEKACQNADMTGMGTTCVAVIVYRSRAYIINIGDSRAYWVCGDRIEQITKDHTMVRMLVDQGKLEERDIKQHPQRNFITRAVGAEATVSADYFEIELCEQDLLLLCSDGLSSYCEEDRILSIIRENELERASELLVAYANEQGGYDNVTVVLLSH